MLRCLFVCCQRIPLTPVDEVKGHRSLLLNERLLLLVRLEKERDDNPLSSHEEIVWLGTTVYGQYKFIETFYI